MCEDVIELAAMPAVDRDHPPVAWMYRSNCGVWFREHRISGAEREAEMAFGCVETPLYSAPNFALASREMAQ